MPTVGASFTKSMKLRPLIGSLATDCSSISDVCSGRVVSITGAPPATVTRSPAGDAEREVDAQDAAEREHDVGALALGEAGSSRR